MELKHYRLIKTIAEEGNIANSSDKLFLTQSALSHQLRDIEEELGFKIFRRSRNNWNLTEEGEEIYQLSKNLFASIDKGLANIQKIAEGSKGTVRISTECYSFYHGLPRFIQKMALLYPTIDVELVLNATHHPIEKILSNEIDIAIVTQVKVNDDLEYIEVFNDEIFALMHVENELSKKEFLEVRDFKTQNLIIHSYPLETVSVYAHLLKPKNINPLKVSAIPLTEVSIEMVEANMGIFCIPKWALQSFSISKNLVYKSLGSKGLKRTHYLVSRKTDKNKKYIREFIKYFEESFLTE